MRKKNPSDTSNIFGFKSNMAPMNRTVVVPHQDATTCSQSTRCSTNKAGNKRGTIIYNNIFAVIFYNYFSIRVLQLFMKTTAAAIKPCCSLKCDKTNGSLSFSYIGRINVSYKIS